MYDIVPKKETMLYIANKMNTLWTTKKTRKDISPDDLIGEPYKFAVAFGIPLYKAYSMTTRAVVHSRNIEFMQNDCILHDITGVYRIFYPSVLYCGAFFASAIRILNDEQDKLFYFELFSNKSCDDRNVTWKIGKLHQFGRLVVWEETSLQMQYLWVTLLMRMVKSLMLMLDLLLSKYQISQSQSI